MEGLLDYGEVTDTIKVPEATDSQVIFTKCFGAISAIL